MLDSPPCLAEITKEHPIKLLDGIPESASFLLCSTGHGGQREGGAFTEPFEQFRWMHFTYALLLNLVYSTDESRNLHLSKNLCRCIKFVCSLFGHDGRGRPFDRNEQCIILAEKGVLLHCRFSNLQQKSVPANVGPVGRFWRPSSMINDHQEDTGR